VPSSFNSQTTRSILLLGAEHDRLWEMVKEVIRGVLPAEKFPPIEKKVDGFKAGYGTVS
jgi:predicted oxidoreductase (fatty acid repression mutant protein)